MDITIISQRYAKALFDLALEFKELEKIKEDMLLVGSVTDENPEFRRLLSSPVIPQGKKAAIIRGIFNKKVEKLTFRFLELVVRKEREVFLKNIADNFISLYKKYKNIITVKLITAQPVDDHIRKEILDILEETTHKNVELLEDTDKKLIGGFVLTMDDKKYDASIRQQINRLQKEFERNPYVKGF
jgi:F-type H+-transporting ATPase subunit delta